MKSESFFPRLSNAFPAIKFSNNSFSYDLNKLTEYKHLHTPLIKNVFLREN